MSFYTSCKLYLFDKNTVKSCDETISCRRTSLIVCAYFEKLDFAYFKKSTSCFKPIISWGENYGLS